MRHSERLIAVCIAVIFCGKSSAFLNGFPKEQCDEMDPTKIKVDDAMVKRAEKELNGTDEPPAIPSSVQLSGSLNLFRIVTSAPQYRRGRVMNITIRGPEFNAFMLQARLIGADERRGFDQVVRAGEFVGWPPSLQPVRCDAGDRPSALTNRDFAPKSGVTVKWRAPKEDVGDIHFVGRFISGDEYWQLTESREIPVNEFPVNLKNCGKDKSCILFSEKSPSCHEDNCDYILTYSVLNGTKVHFVLGGTSKGDQSYIAVGFANNHEADNLKMIACTRAKTAAEIKFFAYHGVEEGLMEHSMHLENKKMDLDGDRMWCSFVAPMVTVAEDDYGLDLSVPHYQIYVRGTTNYTKSANIPIIPSKLLVSKKEVPLDKIKLQYHTMEKTKSSPGAASALVVFNSIFSVLALVPLCYVKKIL